MQGGELRELIRELAEAADELAKEIRPVASVGGELWVTADWLAEKLAALDMRLAVEALDA